MPPPTKDWVDVASASLQEMGAGEAGGQGGRWISGSTIGREGRTGGVRERRREEIDDTRLTEVDERVPRAGKKQGDKKNEVLAEIFSNLRFL